MNKSAATTDNFCITPDYRGNPVAITSDTVSGESYWNPARITRSGLYQYSVYRFASKLITEYKIDSVVDVGCGVGTKLQQIHSEHPQVAIRGVDQADAVGLCRKLHKFGDWYQADLSEPFDNPAARSDLVICADVIEHMENPDVLLESLRRATNPGGHILLSTPDRERLHWPDPLHLPTEHHVREWTSEELRNYLTSRGFELLRCEHHLPIKPSLNTHCVRLYASRIRRRKPLRTNQVCLLRPA